MRGHGTSDTVRPICGAGKESGEEGCETEDEDVDVLDEGAVRGPSHVRDIKIPSQQEVEKRNLTHLPFRNWCPHCMRGRGKEAPHHRCKEGRGELPEISLDFCFPSREGGNGALIILAAKERHSKMILSLVVPSKSTGTFVLRAEYGHF